MVTSLKSEEEEEKEEDFWGPQRTQRTHRDFCVSHGRLFACCPTISRPVAIGGTLRCQTQGHESSGRFAEGFLRSLHDWDLSSLHSIFTSRYRMCVTWLPATSGHGERLFMESTGIRRGSWSSWRNWPRTVQRPTGRSPRLVALWSTTAALPHLAFPAPCWRIRSCVISSPDGLWKSGVVGRV